MDDYISRQAAISLPVLPKEHREYQTFNLDDAYENGWTDALECVEKIPPADVRPVRRGQWKPFDLTYGRSIYSCTSCREASEVPVMMGIPIYRYCPNCGADMTGGDVE